MNRFEQSLIDISDTDNRNSIQLFSIKMQFFYPHPCSVFVARMVLYCLAVLFPPAALPPFRPGFDLNDPLGRSILSRRSIPLFQHIQKEEACLLFSYMELAGIEPASKDSSIKVSPITVQYFGFPRACVSGQTQTVGSFMNLFPPQSLGEKGLPKSMPDSDAGDYTGPTAAILGSKC